MPNLSATRLQSMVLLFSFTALIAFSLGACKAKPNPEPAPPAEAVADTTIAKADTLEARDQIKATPEPAQQQPVPKVAKRNNAGSPPGAAKPSPYSGRIAAPIDTLSKSRQPESAAPPATE